MLEAKISKKARKVVYFDKLIQIAREAKINDFNHSLKMLPKIETEN